MVCNSTEPDKCFGMAKDNKKNKISKFRPTKQKSGITDLVSAYFLNHKVAWLDNLSLSKVSITATFKCNYEGKLAT